MSVTLSIPGASAAATYASAAADLDTNYDVCDGIAFVELTDGTIANGDYDLKVETGNGTPVEQTPIDALQIDKQTPVNERYLDVLFEVRSGKDAKLMAILPAIPAAAMKVKATFRLRKLLVPISIPKV